MYSQIKMSKSAEKQSRVMDICDDEFEAEIEGYLVRKFSNTSVSEVPGEIQNDQDRMDIDLMRFDWESPHVANDS